MSLSYQTPNNALQTMIAIQNKSANIPIFPITEMEDTNQALRTIYQILDSENKTLGIRHLPAPDISNKNNQPQKMLDKENIRQWLIDKGFKGEGKPPKLTDNIRSLLAEKYIELYKALLGKDFIPEVGDVANRIKNNLSKHKII